MRFAIPPTSVPSPVVPVDRHGYMYDLAREAGLSDFGAATVEFLFRPVKIVLIVVAALVVARVGAAALRRTIESPHMRAPLRARTDRAEQRAHTIAEAVARLWRLVVLGIATLLVLGELGLNLAPLIAGAGIAGIAIAFGAQALVRDFLSGVFILTEDQYGVGDIVTIGTATGVVEEVNLRFTRLRHVDGTVWFIPNGEIRAVGNQSMDWSRAIVDLTVAAGIDVASTLGTLADVAGRLRTEPPWSEWILEQPEVIGVIASGPDGLTIRVTAKTAPHRQGDVATELRSRLSDRLHRDGVLAPPRR